MKRSRTLDKALMVTYADPGLGWDHLFTIFESGQIYRSPDNYYPHSALYQVYPGPKKAISLTELGSMIFAAFDQNGIYVCPLGDNLGGGGLTHQVYFGTDTVLKILPAMMLGGVLTAWPSGIIYLSPDGENLGGGGSTAMIYPAVGDPTVKTADLLVYNNELLIAFDDTYIFKCSSATHLHGGAGTVQAYYGLGQSQNVVSKLMQFGTGVLTAFKWGGIYYSGDGLNLGGGGDPATHYRVYPETIGTPHHRMTAMVAYRDGVITAFDNNEIYYSEDGKHLGYENPAVPSEERKHLGGLVPTDPIPDPSTHTHLVYKGQHKLVSIACGYIAPNPGPDVVTVFDNGYMYCSLDGYNLGKAQGNTEQIYP